MEFTLLHPTALNPPPARSYGVAADVDVPALETACDSWRQVAVPNVGPVAYYYIN